MNFTKTVHRIWIRLSQVNIYYRTTFMQCKNNNETQWQVHAPHLSYLYLETTKGCRFQGCWEFGNWDIFLGTKSIIVVMFFSFSFLFRFTYNLGNNKSWKGYLPIQSYGKLVPYTTNECEPVSVSIIILKP